MKPITRLFAVFLLLIVCTGCMYRNVIQQQTENPAFVREELARVESAVKQFYDTRGVYPIKNADETTPEYEKYVIDLNRLVQSNMLSSIPKNSYEAGGRYYYLLIHPETNPAVKLMDLVWVQKTGEVQRAVNSYAAANGGKLPLDTLVSQGFYGIHYDALNMDRVMLQSPYSKHYLPLLIHESGKVIIDYSLDIMEASKRAGSGAELPEGADARELLVMASPLAPFLSFPYEWKNGEPVLTPETIK